MRDQRAGRRGGIEAGRLQHRPPEERRHRQPPVPEGGEAAALGPEVAQCRRVDLDPPPSGADDEAQIAGGQRRQDAAQAGMPQARRTDSGNSPAKPASLAGQTPRSVISPVT